MTKQEFYDLCDQIFKGYGFVKKRRHYYLDLGSDLVGSVYLQGSNYGRATYLNCGFTLKSKEECMPYPNIYDTNMNWRIAVPDKEELYNKPASHEDMTMIIRYEYYDLDELEAWIKNDMNKWVIPAIQNGLDYILAHDELYGRMVRDARRLHKLPN